MHKKPHGKGKHGQKTLRNGEMPQLDSEKSQKGKSGKKHKKPHGKDKRKKELLITDEVTQTVSQKLQGEKPVELSADHAPDSSAQPSAADQDNKEQIATIEDNQTSESLNEAAPPSSFEDDQLLLDLNFAAQLLSIYRQTSQDLNEAAQSTLSSENGQPVDTQELIGAPSHSQESLSTEPLTAEPVEDIEEISPHPSPIAASLVDTEEISAAPTHPKEQIIYLGLDDELTGLLEQIAGAQAQHIILKVPVQAQLRSYAGWRILHARVRQLRKIVQVNSMDRQIRAVARAAGFRVAHHLESPASSVVTRPSDERAGRKPASAMPTLRNSLPLPAHDQFDHDPF